jgi:hypothetical protein
LGGNVRVPGDHRRIEDWTPATQVKPISRQPDAKGGVIAVPASPRTTPRETPASTAAHGGENAIGPPKARPTGCALDRDGGSIEPPSGADMKS